MIKDTQVDDICGMSSYTSNLTDFSINTEDGSPLDLPSMIVHNNGKGCDAANVFGRLSLF